MSNFWAAAKALAQLAGDASDSEVARLLSSGNVWLEAGAMAGLTEARVPGIEGLLQRAAHSDRPALIRAEARACLERLFTFSDQFSAVGVTDGMNPSAR